MEGNEDRVQKTEALDNKLNSSFMDKDEDSLDLDLYGDLSVDLNQEMTYPELKKLHEESKKTIKNLEIEMKKLRDENSVLKKNISSLYLTAREEIKRKDSQIKTLQDKEVKSRRILASIQREASKNS
ncbi:centrosomal protein of 135 kDa-like [Acropora muricata]|uniref:CASP8-associated protein 2-like n=1 Tax=Acropora millepora TaxID=45264 RepID=UPI001CF48B3E|nr:CASP8-associated protein 2-like [Acropora millepora]